MSVSTDSSPWLAERFYLIKLLNVTLRDGLSSRVLLFYVNWFWACAAEEDLCHQKLSYWFKFHPAFLKLPFLRARLKPLSGPARVFGYLVYPWDFKLSIRYLYMKLASGIICFLYWVADILKDILEEVWVFWLNHVGCNSILLPPPPPAVEKNVTETWFWNEEFDRDGGGRVWEWLKTQYMIWIIDLRQEITVITYILQFLGMYSVPLLLRVKQ